jgi:hypothetical protein
MPAECRVILSNQIHSIGGRRQVSNAVPNDRSKTSPKVFRASRCRLRSWSSALTRAYPTRRPFCAGASTVRSLGVGQCCISAYYHDTATILQVQGQPRRRTGQRSKTGSLFGTSKKTYKIMENQTSLGQESLDTKRPMDRDRPSAADRLWAPVENSLSVCGKVIRFCHQPRL